MLTTHERRKHMLDITSATSERQAADPYSGLRAGPLETATSTCSRRSIAT